MSILDSLRPVPDLRVLVTAGAGGVGAAIVRAFHEAGARVHVCDIDRSALERLTSAIPGLTGSMADASVPADVDGVLDDVRGALGGLDVVISNAGIAGPTAPVESIGGNGWERTVAVNLTSHFYFARRAVPLLKQSVAGPCFIAAGSVAGRLGFGFRTPFASSHWGLVGLMKALALELGPCGIRVNAILPGAIGGGATAIAEGALEPEAGEGSATLEAAGLGNAAHDALRPRDPSPQRRDGVDDVASLALFLCSPAARNITGQAISVQGHVECP